MQVIISANHRPSSEAGYLGYSPGFQTSSAKVLKEVGFLTLACHLMKEIETVFEMLSQKTDRIDNVHKNVKSWGINTGIHGKLLVTELRKENASGQCRE
jgi:hypothetical protein